LSDVLVDRRAMRCLVEHLAGERGRYVTGTAQFIDTGEL
jgi:hypothetical protein